jgi:RimJ/RimL family protein N-acetyltransferase
VDTIARYGRPPRADLGITYNNQLVGGVAFREVWVSPPTMEIGWVLHPEVAGRGIAREAVQGLLTWLFGRFPDMGRAESRVRTADTSGVRLLERLGFVQEGVIRGGAGAGGDALLFGLLRAEWKP